MEVSATRRSLKSIGGADRKTNRWRPFPVVGTATARLRGLTRPPALTRRRSTAYREAFQKVALVVAWSKVRETTMPFRRNLYPSIPGWRFQAKVTLLRVCETSRSLKSILGAGTKVSRPRCVGFERETGDVARGFDGLAFPFDCLGAVRAGLVLIFPVVAPAAVNVARAPRTMRRCPTPQHLHAVPGAPPEDGSRGGRIEAPRHHDAVQGELVPIRRRLAVPRERHGPVVLSTCLSRKSSPLPLLRRRRPMS